MLLEHYENVHKRPLLKVPNAILGRRDPQVGAQLVYEHDATLHTMCAQLTFYVSLQVDVVLTTGVPLKAIQDREAALKNAREQYYKGEECDDFNNGNLGDKECLEYEIDTSRSGSSSVRILPKGGLLYSFSCSHHTHSRADMMLHGPSSLCRWYYRTSKCRKCIRLRS